MEGAPIDGCAGDKLKEDNCYCLISSNQKQFYPLKEAIASEASHPLWINWPWRHPLLLTEACTILARFFYVNSLAFYSQYNRPLPLRAAADGGSNPSLKYGKGEIGQQRSSL